MPQERDESGKFLPISDREKRIRSVRISDECYYAMQEQAENLDLSVSAYLEYLYDEGVFSEDDDDQSEKLLEPINRILYGILGDLYQDNELEVPSKEKAAVKRFLNALIDNLEGVIENYL